MDRFSPSSILSKRNAWSAIQCRSNMEGNSLTTMLSIRFLTGFFLAGIYLVGMIAADYFNKGLGKSLGFSALVLGTAFPFTKRNNRCIPMEIVILTTLPLPF
jgi:hypothetical protein